VSTEYSAIFRPLKRPTKSRVTEKAAVSLPA
jgi:hypothetical protein